MKLNWKHVGRVAHRWPKWSSGSKFQWLFCTNLKLELTEVCHWCVLPFLWVKGVAHILHNYSVFSPCLHFGEAEA